MAYVLSGSVSIDMADFWFWFNTKSTVNKALLEPDLFFEHEEVVAVTRGGKCVRLNAVDFWNFVYQCVPDFSTGQFQFSRPVFTGNEIEIRFIASTSTLSGHSEPYQTQYQAIMDSWSDRSHPTHCLSAEVYAKLTRDTRKSVFALFSQMIDDGHQPNLCRRGNKYRAHINVAGSDWSDSQCPVEAIHAAMEI